MSYNGSAFMGSQQQPDTTNTVIGTLIIALKRLQIHTLPKGSGRTDRGVHATHQVMHLDLPLYWNDLRRLNDMLNMQLPHTIRILRIEFVNNDFHARYSAKKRVYRYILQRGENQSLSKTISSLSSPPSTLKLSSMQSNSLRELIILNFSKKAAMIWNISPVSSIVPTPTLTKDI